MTTRQFHEMAAESKPDMSKVLTSTSVTFEGHVDAFLADPDAYASEALRLVKKNVDLAGSTQVRAAALCWRGGRKDVTDALLDRMGFADVLALLKTLDADRQIAALDRKLDRVKKRVKVSAVTQRRHELENVRIPENAPKGASASRSFMKRVRKWVGKLTPDRLEFFLLNFGLEPWKELADLAHLRPSDFQLDYFLPVCFGAEAPQGSLVHALTTCDDPEKLAELLDTHPQLAKCYSYIRTAYNKGCADLPPTVRRALARCIPLVEVIWFYDELYFDELDVVIKERLVRGETIVDETGKGRDNFGKIMERLLRFRQERRGAAFMPQLQAFCEEQLRKVTIPTNARVAVLGDASSSMDIAIKSASIVGSIVCSALDGHLSFFTGNVVEPSVQPKSVVDVLKVSDEIQACGCTSPAATLYPYVEKKTMVDLFIVVTDEGENVPCRSGKMFAALFKEYLEEVNPRATCFFISFLECRDDGYMVQQMQTHGLGEHVRQFRFHPRNPDLSKLNALLALLAAELEGKGPTPILKSCEGASVPIMCKDGPLLVTEEELATVERVFTDIDTITVSSLLETLPRLRVSPADGQADDSRSVFTDWSIVDVLKSKFGQ